MRSWTETPCQIISSSVDSTRDEEHPYQFAVAYKYQWEGAPHRSSEFKRGGARFGDYQKAAKLMNRYPAGSKGVCYVDPENPADAVLERSQPWIVLAVFFPLIFVVIGLGGIYFTWRGSPRASPAVEQPKSTRPKVNGRVVGVPFFALFLVAGLAAFYWMLIGPLIRMSGARGWTEVPCQIISSAVRSHRGDDSTTYKVDILYEYEIDGRKHRSNRYAFLTGSSSGYGGKARVVHRYPPGSRQVCYVSPKDPSEAVLHRGWVTEMWFGFLPLLFVAAGAGGLVFTLRPGRPSPQAVPVGPAAAMAITRPGSPPGESGRVTLRPRFAPVVKLVTALLVTLFWNGIISVFLVHAIDSWRRGRPEWFLTIFLIPFVLIGLGLAGFSVHALLGLFNPRPVLTVSSGAVALGHPFTLEWRMRGRVERLRRLSIFLEGQEECTYRRGTSTSTDRSVFARVPVIEADRTLDFRQGVREATIPGDTMHSFRAPNNKILWAIRVRGEIPRWPDVDEEYPFEVLPASAMNPNPPMTVA